MALFPYDNRSTVLSNALDYLFCCLSESRLSFHFRQEIPEFAIVDLHAVIQVEADPLVSIMAKLFIKTLCPRRPPSVLQVSV